MVDVQILEVSRERAKQLRPRPGQLLGRRWRSRRKRRRAADAEAVQPEHDFARRQHRRLLPGGAVGGRAVPRERLADQGAGEAAPARRRRAEAVAEPRRRRAGAEHDVHAAGGRRRRGQPADVVQLPHRSASSSSMTPRVTYDGDIILDLTLENSARGQDTQHRRPEPAVVLLAQGDDQAAAARRRVEPAGRACCARTSADR